MENFKKAKFGKGSGQRRNSLQTVVDSFIEEEIPCNKGHTNHHRGNRQLKQQNSLYAVNNTIYRTSETIKHIHSYCKGRISQSTRENNSVALVANCQVASQGRRVTKLNEMSEENKKEVTVENRFDQIIL